MFRTLFFTSLSITLLGTILAFSTVVRADSKGQKTSQYLLSQQDASGSIGGLANTGWAVQALIANNQRVTSSIDYLKNNLATLTSATDLERTILALTALGSDPRDISDRNLISELKSKYADGQIGSISQVNDDIFGVLALLSASETPESSVLKFIGNSQRPDGSFSWSTHGNGDSNSTAAAIEALEFAHRKGISVSYNRQAAISFIKSTQNNDGGFSYLPNQESDSASTSWVISGITALGQQPEGWQKNGNSPYDFLSTMQTDSGGVRWRSDSNPDILTTSYAAIAFAHKALPVAIVNKMTPTPSPSSPTAKPSPSSSPVTPSPTKIPSSIPSAPSPKPSIPKKTSPPPTHPASPSPSRSTSSPSVFLSTSPIPRLLPSPTMLARSDLNLSPASLPTPTQRSLVLSNIDSDGYTSQSMVSTTVSSSETQTSMAKTSDLPKVPKTQASSVAQLTLVDARAEAKTDQTLVHASSDSMSQYFPAILLIIIGSGLAGWGLGRASR